VLRVVSVGIWRRGMVVDVGIWVDGFWGSFMGVGEQKMACEACVCCLCFRVLEACKSNFRNDDLALKNMSTTGATRTYRLKSSTTFARYTSASTLVFGFSSISTVDSRCYSYSRACWWSVYVNCPVGLGKSTFDLGGEFIENELTRDFARSR